MNTISEGFIKNIDTSIHYIEIRSDKSKIPLIVIPGMIENAEEYLPIFASNPLLRTIYIISIRGRGKSDAPEFGYSLDHQTSDIEAFLREQNITSAYILGISTGVAFALNCALKNPQKIKCLILGDFAPYYPQYSEKWAIRINSINSTLSPIARDGIVREAEKVILVGKLSEITVPVLLLKGKNDDSLLPEKVVEIYKANLSKCHIIYLEQSGHSIFESSSDICLQVITEFLENIEALPS